VRRLDGELKCEEVARCIAEEAAGVLRDLVAALAPAHKSKQKPDPKMPRSGGGDVGEKRG